VRLFVTSTKLYSSHQHRISDVGTLLLQKPIVRQVDLFVETPQRFGAVRDLRSSLACADVPGFNPDRAWQTLMRWLRYFLSNRYMLSVPNFSEVFWSLSVCLRKFRGILSLYTSTQLQQAVVAKLAERFLGSSSQDNTAQLRARRPQT
jgi:hypothetical protein